MDLLSITAPSREIATTKKTKPRTIELMGIAALASNHSRNILAVRNQTLVVEPSSKKPKVTMDQQRLNALMVNAIEEVSALTSRHAMVRIQFTKQEIVISGQNLLDLPNGELTLDRMLRLRAWPLQIRPTLRWDQGLGPVLTLSLPPQKVAVSMKKSVEVKIRQAHVRDGQRRAVSSRA